MYRAEHVLHGEVLSTDYGFYWLAREGGGVLWLRGDAAHEGVELYPKDGENLCFSSSEHSSTHTQTYTDVVSGKSLL